MKLAEFLTLSGEEEKAYQAILLVKRESKEEEKSAELSVSKPVFNCIIGIDLAVLIKIALKYPLINALCESPQFALHWQEQWRQSGLNPPGEFHRSELPTHEYAPMPTISCFQLLQGLYIYKTYRKRYAGFDKLTPALQEEAREYLELSSKLGCFFAINVLCKQGLERLEEAKPDRQLVFQMLDLAKKAADLYWTPGYLLLSTVTQELSLYADALFKDKYLLPQQIFFRDALVALKVAQKLEKDSEAMLNNAYQGKTLEQASQGAIRSWLQANVRLKNFSNGFIDDMIEWDAEKTARVRVEQIKAQYLKAVKRIEEARQKVLAAESSPFSASPDSYF